MTYIRSFREIRENEINIVGYKGLSVAKLFNSGFKTAPGFVIASKAYKEFMNKEGLNTRICSYLAKISENPDNLRDISSKIQELVVNSKFTPELEEEIIESYLSLGFDPQKSDAASLLANNEVFVAVRPSPLEDENIRLEPGIPTLLNVKGKERLLNAIKKAYSSLFVPELIRARTEKKLGFDEGIAVIIQKMINSVKSGIAFSENNESTSANEILIKACFGLGEALASNNIYPDIYVVDSTNLKIKSVKISEKEFEYVLDRVNEGTAKNYLKEKGKTQVLNDKEITEIAGITKRIASELSAPQKIEWAIAGNEFHILQSKSLIGQHNADNDLHKERVEFEIYGSDDEEITPEIIDIDDNFDMEDEVKVLDEIEKKDPEEDLLLLDPAQDDTEIEKIESLANIEDKFAGLSEEKINLNIKKKEEKISVVDPGFVQEEAEYKNDAKILIKAVNKEENIAPEDLPGKEEEFIFSSIEKESPAEDKNEIFSINKTSAEPKKILENAFFNAGNVIVLCDMAILSKLRQLHLNKFGAEMNSFDILIDKLGNELDGLKDKIVRIHELKADFAEGCREPSSYDLEMALNTAKKFIDEV